MTDWVLTDVVPTDGSWNEPRIGAPVFRKAAVPIERRVQQQADRFTIILPYRYQPKPSERAILKAEHKPKPPKSGLIRTPRPTA